MTSQGDPCGHVRRSAAQHHRHRGGHRERRGVPRQYAVALHHRSRSAGRRRDDSRQPAQRPAHDHCRGSGVLNAGREREKHERHRHPASEIAQWDPEFTATIKDKVYPIVQRWFRSEVRGMESMPPGAALVVSNHSGGYSHQIRSFSEPTSTRSSAMSALLHAGAQHGADGTSRDERASRRCVIHASRENAAEALESGAVVLVFPGGDHDSYRPTSAENVIDFNGRTGYVRTAVDAACR